MKLKLIIPLGEVPMGSQVRKISGSKLHTVKDRIIIYGAVPPQIIHAVNDCVFLIGQCGEINAHSKTKEVVWETDLETLAAVLGE